MNHISNKDLINNMKTLESDINYLIIEMCGNKSVQLLVKQYFELANELASRLGDDC